MAKLKTWVHVDGKAYGPSDGDLPASVARKITNPNVWDGPPPRQTKASPTPAAGTGGGAGDGGAGGDGPVIPPKGGAGSGKDAWVAYASEVAPDLELADDASRDDVIAALEDAGIPTE